MNMEHFDMVTRKGEHLMTVDNGILQLVVDSKMGTYDVHSHGQTILSQIASAFELDGEMVYTTDYSFEGTEISAAKPIQDAIGKGNQVIITYMNEGRPLLKQRFIVYEWLPFLSVRIELAVVRDQEPEIKTSYMAPLITLTGDSSYVRLSGYEDTANSVTASEEDQLQALLVPFDNDKWVRYESRAMPDQLESFEVSAIFNPSSRNGCIVGSITHDTWKTGLKISSTKQHVIDRLEVYGGAAGELTRDSIAHGAVTGLSVQSPEIFIGIYEDYRIGLEAFGRANAANAPALPWEQGVPFGWNSWSAAADKLDYDLYVRTSDFLRRLQDKGYHNDGVVYINFDSFWTNLSQEELGQAVKHVRNNGQKAGIYWTPFAFWGKDIEREVEGTNGRYRYEELLLRDRVGNILPSLDGGLAIDPTHPGNIMRTHFHLDRFVEWGFEYVKLDFLGHGALEGSHREPGIQTGIQAYNFGMEFIKSHLDPARIGRPFHINLSIAPLFPHQYGHSRRISCDAFGLLTDSEYMLNSLTYGWWMNDNLYRFNDPDHTVMYKSYNQEPSTYHEGRSRLNASVVAGTVMMMGDDFRKPEACLRAEEWLGNSDIMRLARSGRTFVPLESSTGSGASDVFVLRLNENGESSIYVAVFNFHKEAGAQKVIPLVRLDATYEQDSYRLKDLWTGTVTYGKGNILVSLEAAESKLMKLSLNGV